MIQVLLVEDDASIVKVINEKKIIIENMQLRMLGEG